MQARLTRSLLGNTLVWGERDIEIARQDYPLEYYVPGLSWESEGCSAPFAVRDFRLDVVQRGESEWDVVMTWRGVCIGTYRYTGTDIESHVVESYEGYFGAGLESVSRTYVARTAAEDPVLSRHLPEMCVEVCPGVATVHIGAWRVRLPLVTSDMVDEIQEGLSWHDGFGDGVRSTSRFNAVSLEAVARATGDGRYDVDIYWNTRLIGESVGRVQDVRKFLRKQFLRPWVLVRGCSDRFVVKTPRSRSRVPRFRRVRSKGAGA